MKLKIGLGASIAVMLGAGISAALAQVTLTGTNGTLVCSSHNGVQVASNGAITINVGNCDLGGGSGGDNGSGGPVAPTLIQSTNNLSLQQGSEGSFTVGLSSAPAQNVTLPLNSSNPGIATVTPSSLLFTTSNWGAQTVTVDGVGAGIANITGTAGSLSVSLTANVTAASTGGGTGGGDLGLGIKWETSYQNQNVFVVDRSAYSNRTYFPGCLSQNWPALGLNHNRSLNPFDGSVSSGCRGIGSLRAGAVYAQRLPFTTATKPFTIKLARAEAGETGIQAYDFALSTTPGDLNPTHSRCVMRQASEGTISLVSRTEWLKLSSLLRPAYCPLDENTIYYLNFRPTPGTEGATKCGNNGFVCRVQVITDIPGEYFQDARVKTDSY